MQGDRKYLVTLAATGTTLTHSCDCPMGEKGDFCKHSVAVALAWLNVPKLSPALPAAPSQPNLQDAARFLAAEDKSAIIQTLLDWARSDPHLHERLLLYAARRTDPALPPPLPAKPFRTPFAFAATSVIEGLPPGRTTSTGPSASLSNSSPMARPLR